VAALTSLGGSRIRRIMHLIRKTKQRYLVSLTPEELTGISNALNEVCNGVDIADAEFQTRLGYSRSRLTSILQQLGEAFAAADANSMEVSDAWSDAGSVQVRAISVSGDPVDMSAEEALSFAALITRCAHEADAA
jgi:hypothetical protein